MLLQERRPEPGGEHGGGGDEGCVRGRGARGGGRKTFHARLLLLLRIRDGATDRHLVEEYEGFPLGEDGQPTFRPSALWYLSQIDFPNGTNVRIIESTVTREGKDLLLTKRIEGDFFERFELQNFPFDAQDLTITVGANCANEGPVPVEFTVDGPDAQFGVDTTNFAFDDIWRISESVAPEITTTGACLTRRFPAVHLRACISRRPNFIILNVAVPTMAISLISLFTFVPPPQDVSDRLELSMAVLLTAIAFKYVTAAYLPHISYLTLVDKFVMLCTSVIILTNLVHAILGTLHIWFHVRSDILDLCNKVFAGAMSFYLLYILLWFVRCAGVARKSDTGAGQRRASVSTRQLLLSSSSLRMEGVSDRTYSGNRIEIDQDLDTEGHEFCDNV